MRRATMPRHLGIDLRHSGSTTTTVRAARVVITGMDIGAIVVPMDHVKVGVASGDPAMAPGPAGHVARVPKVGDRRAGEDRAEETGVDLSRN